jgi:hypothetical protein
MQGEENRVVGYFFQIPRKSIAFAFWSMAVDRIFTRNFPGVHFSKLLGTGTGKTFTPSDAELTRWGMILVIDSESIDSFDDSAVIARWRRRANNEFRVIMKPISSHGLWAKRNPFDFAEPQRNPDSIIAAITRARIKWSKNFIFWRSVPPVVTDLHSSPGLIAAIGIGEAPIGLQGTFSLWESAGALRTFAYKGAAHQRAIADTKRIGWYSEELFSRFEVIEQRGSLNHSSSN